MSADRPNNYYQSWDEYFMATAYLTSLRSEDPNDKAGTCIANSEKKIVAIGYKAMPTGWKDAPGEETSSQDKHLYVCHAEMNAIVNKTSVDVRDCVLYTTLFPCNVCVKLIIQSGIKKVVYLKNAEEDDGGERMLEKAGIERTAFKPQRRLDINFEALLGKYIRCGGGNSGDQSVALDRDEYFMVNAYLAAIQSKDPRTKVGACIVNPANLIVGTGYNGMPNRCYGLPWDRKPQTDEETYLDTKHPYVCHAEMNAIANKTSADVRGCVLYTTLFPCNECAKLIIQSGIKGVIYLTELDSKKTFSGESWKMFKKVNIQPKRIQCKLTEIDFGENGNNDDKTNKRRRET